MTIKKLPEELLMVIISEICLSNQPLFAFYEVLASLARVNWRFHRLAQPLLYADPHVNCCAVCYEESQDYLAREADLDSMNELDSFRMLSPGSTLLLHGFLEQNRSLWSLCLRLVCFACDFQRMAHDFVRWCFAAKSLVVGFVKFHNEMSLVDQAQRHMRRLKRLTMAAYDFDTGGESLVLKQVAKHANGFSRLQTLELSSVRMTDETLKM